MSLRRERSDAAAHRRLILQTAQSLFAKHGVKEVSMHQIAKSAGIGQGTLYRRYAHKGDLCSDLMDDKCQSILSTMNDYLMEHAALSPQERLGGMLDLMIDFIDEMSQLLIPLHAVYLSEAADKSVYFRSPLYRGITEILVNLLKEMGDELPADPSFTAHMILSSMNPFGYLHLRQDRGYTKEEIKLQFRKLFAGK